MKITPETYEEAKEFISLYGSRDKVPIHCASCGEEVLKPKSKIQEAIKNGKSLHCTAKCYSNSVVNRVTLECEVCGKEVERIPSAIKSHVFCGSSCAAVHNNTVAPKRGKGINYVDGEKVPASHGKNKRCACGKRIWNVSEMCSKCRLDGMKSKATEDYLSKTFGDFKKDHNYVSHNYYIKIRTGSRRLAKLRGMEKVCKVCGYDTYAELCHIKDISKFPDEATMAEINSPENLVYLCPNHHKELGLGLLKLA